MNPIILKQNQELIETYFNRVWNKGELELLDSLIDEHYINHSPGGSVVSVPGPEGLKPIVSEMRKGLPDLHYSIKDLVITEDKIAARVVMRATFLGELWGMQPNGRQIEVDQINLEHLRNGKIIEHWRLTDERLLMKQLGQE